MMFKLGTPGSASKKAVNLSNSNLAIQLHFNCLELKDENFCLFKFFSVQLGFVHNGSTWATLVPERSTKKSLQDLDMNILNWIFETRMT